jgi:peptide chain release factor 1
LRCCIIIASAMIEKLELIQKRYDELGQLLAREEIATDRRRLEELSKERAGLEDIVETYQQYKAKGKELAELEALLDSHTDVEMTALVKEEVSKLRQHQNELLDELKLALTPRDPNDEKDVIVEIRAGAGGEEASLFAGDLFRMYSRYAQAKSKERVLLAD